jgi:hypothetical protein
MKHFFAILFLIYIFSGCRAKPTRPPNPVNDTTQIINFAILTALINKDLGDIDPLFRGKLFNDSILIAADSLPLRLLPAGLAPLKFKFFDLHQIAFLKHKYDSLLLPNYLFLCCFKKLDSTYSISVQSRSLVPFGGGGSIEINIGRKGDSLFVIDRSGNSIN